MTRSTLSRRSMVTGVASLAGLALFAGCDEEEALYGQSSGTQTTGQQTTQQQTTQQQTSSQETSSQQETSSERQTSSEQETTEQQNGKSGQKELPINVKGTDPHVGDTITVLSAIRHFSTPGLKERIPSGSEIVLLKVKVDPSTKYTGIISTLEFQLEGSTRPIKGTSTYDEYIREAGLTPFGMASRRKGTRTGWMAFRMYDRDQSESYQGAYLRPKSKVTSTQELLPEYKLKFTIGS